MPPKKITATMKTSTPARTANISRKRKATSAHEKEKGDEEEDTSPPPNKKASRKKAPPEPSSPRQTTLSTEAASTTVERPAAPAPADEKPILINRAPVLELWSACVAQATHPDLGWPACLSIGSSVATLTAVSKGRSIGAIDRPGQQKKPEEDKEGKEDSEEGEGGDMSGPTVSVMGFPMTLRDGAVLVRGKPRAAREAGLARRFGEAELERAKCTMLDALGTWKGSEKELDRRAFGMYEEFRPEVPRGQKGWGRKGELRLGKIKSVVRKK